MASKTHQWNSQERRPLPECPVNSRPCKHTQQIGANDVMGVLFSALIYQGKFKFPHYVCIGAGVGGGGQVVCVCACVRERVRHFTTSFPVHSTVTLWLDFVM